MIKIFVDISAVLI